MVSAAERHTQLLGVIEVCALQRGSSQGAGAGSQAEALALSALLCEVGAAGEQNTPTQEKRCQCCHAMLSCAVLCWCAPVARTTRPSCTEFMPYITHVCRIKQLCLAREWQT